MDDCEVDVEFAALLVEALRVRLARQQIESIQNLRWNAKTERVMKALAALDKEIVAELEKRWKQTEAALRPKPKKGKP